MLRRDMLRRGIVALALVGWLSILGQQAASAHAALQGSDPAAGTVYDHAPPTAVRLSFSEAPEPSLSVITVTDPTGAVYQNSAPRAAAGDPLSLVVALKPLDKRVYTVTWRIFSRVDGHPTSGAFAFGVGVLPTPVAAAAANTTPALSSMEVVGRWLLIAGLIGLLGAGGAAVARFGNPTGGALGAGAWLAGAIGLGVFAEAQRRNASASFSALWPTSVGHALAGRAIALGCAGGALTVARLANERWRPYAMAAVAGTASAAMAVHVAAGHAAGSAALRWVNVAVQWAHFAAVGLWIGGLAALLLTIRGRPSDVKATMVRRFSVVAASALGVVAGTGIIAARHEVKTWGALTATGYGQVILVKSGLILLIASLAAWNRMRNLGVTGTNLRPLRRASVGEIVLATAAVVAAATLAGLAPPAAQATTASGLSVAGHDFATSVKVGLTTLSPRPGPNRFEVRVVDYDSGHAIRADRITLRFTAPDDPELVPTTLELQRQADGSYAGLGNNLAFDGRWQVAVLIERGAGTVQVSLALETRSAPQFVSIARIPGTAPVYSVQIADETLVSFSPNPERPGPSKLTVNFYDVISDARPVDRVAITIANGSADPAVALGRRAGPGEFVAEVTLRGGHNRITATGRTPDGARLWAAFDLTVNGR